MRNIIFEISYGDGSLNLKQAYYYYSEENYYSSFMMTSDINKARIYSMTYGGHLPSYNVDNEEIEMYMTQHIVDIVQNLDSDADVYLDDMVLLHFKPIGVRAIEVIRHIIPMQEVMSKNIIS